MLTAILHPGSYEYYLSLMGAAPIKMMTPPTVWLSPPEMKCTGLAEGLRGLSEDQLPIIKSKMAIFRHVFNPRLSRTGFYGSMLFEETLDLRTLLDQEDLDNHPGLMDAFQPHALFVYDGMVSSSSRAYLKSVSESLFKNTLTWVLGVADENNPDHSFLFDHFNPEVSDELQGSELFKAGRIL